MLESLSQRYRNRNGFIPGLVLGAITFFTLLLLETGTLLAAADAIPPRSTPNFLGFIVSDGCLVVLLLAFCGVGAALSLFVSQTAIPFVILTTGSLASIVSIMMGATCLLWGAPFEASLWTIPGISTLRIKLDALSGFFVLITGTVGLATSIFSYSYLQKDLRRYSLKSLSVFYHLLLASIVLVLLADEAVTFLLAWELMTIFSYLLVNSEHEDADVNQAAFLMLGMSEAGLIALVLAFLLIGVNANSLAFRALQEAGHHLSDGLRYGIFILSLLGFGVKMGLVPLSSWLPRAYRAAPSNVCALMSATVTNLGVYGILRINCDILAMSSVSAGLILMIVGSASALIGILYATTADDIKSVLAHSSIENFGIIVTTVGACLVFLACNLSGAATIALTAALYHTLNHALYKALLFIGSGSVELQTGSRSLNKLGGLLRAMPWTGTAMLAGALSISGMPPFNGFTSEWLTLESLLLSSSLPTVAIKVVFVLCGTVLALTLGLTITCFVRLFAMTFLGVPRSPDRSPVRETRFSARIVLLLLALACFLLGVGTTYVIPTFDPIVERITGSSPSQELVPAFFATNPHHSELTHQFVEEFHGLGAQIGQDLLPGRGLVVMHRGGSTNPVVFAMATAYLALVLGIMIAVVWSAVWILRTFFELRATRSEVWAGGIRKLLPQMVYTATGFSNPVRVIFDAVLKPTIIEDTCETIGNHFRTAIRRTRGEVYVLDRLLLNPITQVAQLLARFFAKMHHGLLNAYVFYGFIALLILLILAAIT